MMVRRIGGFFSALPVRLKLILFFFVLVALPLILLSTLIFGIMQQSLVAQVENQSVQCIEQSMLQIENNLRELDKNVLTCLWNAQVQQTLQRSYQDETLAQRRANGLDMEAQLQALANTRLDVELLYILRNDEEQYHYATMADPLRALKRVWELRTLLGDDAQANNGRMVWTGEQVFSGYITGIRTIYDVKTLRKLGTFIAEINEQKLRALYTGNKTTNGSFFVIRGPDGKVISSDAPEGADQSALLSLSPGVGALRSTYSNGYFIVGRRSVYLGWDFYQCTPRGELMADVLRMQLVVLGTLILMLAALIVIMMYFAHYMTEPVKNLASLMHSLEQEDFTVRADVVRNDEFGELGRVFNSMAGKLRYLIEEVYQGKLITREAEYKYLRAQINPHFLCNTLDSINWMAQMGGMTDISKMVVALGRLMRRSISDTGEVHTLREELESLRDYLTIQGMRFGERLRYEIAVPDGLLGYIVPKMVLQPLVENAIIHGIEKKLAGGCVSVSAHENSGTLELRVKDDGIGIPGEKAEQVLARGVMRDEKGHGVGISNVNMRVKMLFGNEYGISIQSEPDAGTEMILRAPAVTAVRAVALYPPHA